MIAQYKALVRELGEDPHNVVLSAGAAVVMLGIRNETVNLDADVLPGVFKWAATTKSIEKLEGISERVVYAESIGLHILDEDRGRVCVDGVWIYSPRELIIQKRGLVYVPTRGLGKLVQDQIEIAQLEQMGHSTKFTAKAV